MAHILRAAVATGIARRRESSGVAARIQSGDRGEVRTAHRPGAAFRRLRPAPRLLLGIARATGRCAARHGWATDPVAARHVALRLATRNDPDGDGRIANPDTGVLTHRVDWRL